MEGGVLGTRRRSIAAALHGPQEAAGLPFRRPPTVPRRRSEGEKWIVGQARFLTGLTFYARNGDIFAYASVVMTLALLILARRRVQ